LGISTHYYTVYGIKIDGYDDALSDVLYSDEDRNSLFEDKILPEDFGIIMDGMSGEYMVLGKVLFDSGDQRYSEIKDVFVATDLTKLADYRRDYMRTFSEYFPQFDHYLDEPWKLITFAHYS
jgi:hypothetical protein